MEPFSSRSSHSLTPHSTSFPGSGMTTVRALMTPIRRRISVTQSLGEAAHLIDGVDGGAVLLDLSHRPVGLITESDLAERAARHPERWRRMRCACLVKSTADFLAPGDPVECALARYRTGDPLPLLVLDRMQAVGTLLPDDVFAWCLAHSISIDAASGSRSRRLPSA